jgi:proton glutamate symport protein
MRFFWLFLVALGLGTKRHWHILFAIVLGVILGLLFSGPQYAPLHGFFEVVGQVFIRLINMIVIPLVVSSLIVGVASLGDNRQLGRLGGRVLSLFFMLMLSAAVLGAGLVLFFQPGQQVQDSILNENLSQAFRQSVLSAESQPLRPPELRELFFNMIPQNIIASLAKAELVPVILFTLLFGLGIAYVGDAGRPLITLFESLFTVTMKLTDWIMVLSVSGIFSLTFITVASAGPGIFVKLAPYMLVIVMGLLAQVFIIFPLMLRLLAKIDFLTLYRAISEAIMVAFGTASSSATLPITIACCERRVGISNRIASFVLPTGVTINKTATTLFEVVAVIFLAQAYNIPLETHTMVLILFFAMIASVGTAGVPSGGLLTIAVVFNSLGYSPLAFTGGLALLWSVDRVLDMCRTVVNVIGTCSVAAVVASQEGELNRDILNNREVWSEVV